MIDFEYRRLFRSALLLIVVVGFAFARPVEAELVELNDGGFHAGHIIEETPTQLRLTTGDEAGSRTITLPRNTIRRIYRDLDEAERIGQCADEGRLRQWAAAYFHADLAANATQCVEQVFEIAPHVGDAPLKRGAKPFRAFWNRAVLRQRTLRLAKPDVRDHVKFARWAREADLRDEAAYHLRQGWCKKRDSASVIKYAKKWDVALESWVRPDLRSSMEMSLFTDVILDDRSTVTARPGMQFLQIPLRYDATRGNRLLSKSVVRGKERRSYYGIRVSDRALGRRGLETDRSPVIHERVELTSRPGDGPQLTLKNNFGPREEGMGDAPRQRLRAPSQTVTPSGWAVLVLEVPQRSKTLTLHWDDGGFETIRLDYLREFVGAMLDPKLRAPESRMIGKAIAQLERPSASMAELALVQLAWIRRQIAPNVLVAWTSRVEPAVLRTATRVERHLRIAAWDYFAEMESTSPAALRALGRMGKAVHLAWIEVFREHELAAEGDVPAMLVPMLTAILRSKDPAVCGATIETLLDLHADLDWSFISTASETAQLAALDRVHSLPGPQRARMLITLMKAVRKTSADQIARYAESFNLHLTDPRDPVLSQWHRLKDNDERCALLTILESLDLGDLVYSRPVGNIIRESLDADCDPAVREAMFSLVVGQMRRPLQALREAGGDSHGFPVLVDVKSRDPILMALTEAAVRSAPPLRDEALSVLLALGYAQLAEVALLATIEKPGDLDERIKALIGRVEIARSDGLLAMFGRLLDEKHESVARRILSHLSNVAATAGGSRWRVYAAVKAGVDLKELAALTVSRHPLISGPAERWLFALGHLTPQDRERFTTPMDARQRIERLERIDARRARLVAGEYGAIAIVETTLFREEALHEDDESLAGSMMRWRVPRRTTLTLPPMTFRMDAATDTYAVFCQGKQIGRGTIRITAPPRGLLDPASFSIRLADAEPPWFGRDGWGWPSPLDFGQPKESAVGSVMLGSRPVRNAPTPGTMTLDLTDILRTALPDVDLTTADHPEVLDPRRCRITLRYAAFASYYGVGKTRRLPMDRVVTGKRHLINFMLILEKRDS